MMEEGLSCQRSSEGTLVITLAGRWQLQRRLPPIQDVQREIESGTPPRRVTFDASRLTGWDTSLLTFLGNVTELCRKRGVVADRDGLPAGVRRLLELAEAVPEKEGARKETMRASLLERIGEASITSGRSASEFLAFVGNVTITLGKLLTGKARYRNFDLLTAIQECGAQALPIVTLISFLVGMIFAFVGAVQLEQFGAAIYVADLVGIAMVREMGAMMTAIVMAGRTGAAFAAELGSMKVNQETDALQTMGISPMEFLVLPRIMALCLMMPMLCLYADLVGILGGAAVSVSMLGLSPMAYYNETVRAVTLTDLFGGMFKASVYGVLVAISGCLRGVQCGNSSSAVGEAATSAVVTGIVLIISACGVFSVVFYILGI